MTGGTSYRNSVGIILTGEDDGCTWDTIFKRNCMEMGLKNGVELSQARRETCEWQTTRFKFALRPLILLVKKFRNLSQSPEEVAGKTEWLGSRSCIKVLNRNLGLCLWLLLRPEKYATLVFLISWFGLVKSSSMWRQWTWRIVFLHICSAFLYYLLWRLTESSTQEDELTT